MSSFERGIFTLSLDLELIWGTQDLFGPDAFRGACTRERALVGRLLGTLEKFGIPATWCVVGHLLLDSCEGAAPKHPEIVRPTHAWVRGDWFQHDPGGTEETAPLFLGRSLVESIRACRVAQEVGCHSFSHVIFGDRGCSRDTAVSEVGACVALARGLGLDLRSFAFPRNCVGHLDVLKEHGFACFRGPGPHWYEQDDSASLLGRMQHLLDVVRAPPPPTVLPERTPEGLWNIPGSMIYFPMHGLRRHVPMSRRVLRAHKGLADAVRRRRIFHLWFHPTNLADETEAMFIGLEAILGEAARLREEGSLRVLTMSGVANEANARVSAA
jgi:hypothetical protein